MTLYGYARVSVREPEDKNLDLTVHPHPRGESITRKVPKFSFPGSPPPAWGKPAYNLDYGLRLWFTPTRVGKARLQPRLRPAAVVHPHPRGESWGSLAYGQPAYGSPPPAWGKLVL